MSRLGTKSGRKKMKNVVGRILNQFGIRLQNFRKFIGERRNTYRTFDPFEFIRESVTLRTKMSS